MIRRIGRAARRQGVNGCTSTSASRAPIAAGAARGGALVAPRPAGRVGQLTFADGEETGMLPTARPSSPSCARRRAARLAGYGAWEAWVDRLVPARRDGGLHTCLVGCAATPAARHARDPRCRPADLARAHRPPRADGARPRRRRAVAHGGSRRLHPESLGQPRSRGSMPPCSTRTASRRQRRATSRAHCSGRAAGAGGARPACGAEHRGGPRRPDVRLTSWPPSARRFR